MKRRCIPIQRGLSNFISDYFGFLFSFLSAPVCFLIVQPFEDPIRIVSVALTPAFSSLIFGFLIHLLRCCQRFPCQRLPLQVFLQRFQLDSQQVPRIGFSGYHVHPKPVYNDHKISAQQIFPEYTGQMSAVYQSYLAGQLY